MKRLSEMKIGEVAAVSYVGGEGKIRRRLLDMGITPGTGIYLRKMAPFGDPIEITIRNYELTLRKEEAKYIELEVNENE